MKGAAQGGGCDVRRVRYARASTQALSNMTTHPPLGDRVCLIAHSLAAGRRRAKRAAECCAAPGYNSWLRRWAAQQVGKVALKGHN